MILTIHLYTLIRKEDGYICVELNKGNEQGFMTQFTYNNFSKMVNCVEFLPITTRSVEQYKRIIWPDAFVPEYALVANGAVLLHNNEVDDSWSLIQKESIIEKLNHIYHKYRKDKRFVNCRIVDSSYFFVYCSGSADIRKIAIELKADNPIEPEQSGKKIYFFPDGLNKGNALKKFCKSNCFDVVYAAGDSRIDLTLLNEADKALIPLDYQYFEQITSEKQECNEKVFSDFVIRTITSL